MLTSRAMLILAQTILLCGTVGLSFASWRLFDRAVALGLPVWAIAAIVPVAALMGWAKARFVMRKRMVANVARLRATTGRLWPWQIYPPQLLAFIIAMVVLMRVLKRVLAGSATGMGALGGVDVLIAVALLVASSVYRERPRSAAPEAA